MNWNNTIAQIQPALKFLLIADCQYRIWATEGCQVACSLTGLTIGNNTSNTQLLSSLNGSMSQEELLVNHTIFHWINIIQWRLILLCLLSNTCHGLHSFYRILTACCLTRKHQRISAIKDSIGNIGYLSTGRTWILNHGMQHLCSHDYRFLRLHTLRDDAALDARNSLDWHLDTQVTTSNHDTI